jgi:hypothetical protein
MAAAEQLFDQITAGETAGAVTSVRIGYVA